MIWHITAERLCTVPRGLVAAHAVRGCQIEVVVDVALSTGCGRVRTDEGEPRGAVIEGSGCPSDCIVAVGAVRGRVGWARSGVRRIIGLLPSREVAARIAAIRGCDLQIVIVVDVALRASGHFTRGRHLVGVCEREAGGAVIESRVRPVRGVVTRGALGYREARRNMIRDIATKSLRAVPLCEMAARVTAVRRSNLQSVIVVDVALSAGRRDVCASQRKPSDAVIKGGNVGPRDGVVALRAVRSCKCGSSRGVHRIVGFLPCG